MMRVTGRPPAAALEVSSASRSSKARRLARPVRPSVCADQTFLAGAGAIIIPTVARRLGAR
jgi:hypothetical protein